MKQINAARIISRALLNLLVFLFVLIWLVPTLGLLVSSFRSTNVMSTSGWWTSLVTFQGFTLDNYREVLTYSGLALAFLNSLIIAVPSTFIQLVIASLAAYGFAVFKFPGKKILFVSIVALQIIPLQITLIPVLKMLNTIQLSGTFPGVWLAHTAYGLPLSIYLLRNFFASVPMSLVESARMDGANNLSIFIKILVPLSIPALASLMIFQFVWIWNDLLISLVFLGGNPQVAPLTVKIASMSGSLESGWNIMTAAAFLSMLLPLLIFFSLQKYFIKGLLAGGVKY